MSGMARRARISLFALAVIVVVTPAYARQAISAQTLTDQQIRAAIDALVEDLYARKHPDRLWEPEKIPPGDSTRQKGGYTSLVVLAMLYAGQSYQDPRLRDAVEYLASQGMEGTYAVTLRASVWSKLPAKFNDKLTADTKWLIDGFSEKIGGWDYVQDARSSRKDNSIRQFGALAWWEAAKRNQKIERRYWQRLEDALIEMQLEDGGWNYTGDGKATGSMTAAGLTTLFITQGLLHDAEATRLGGERSTRHQRAIDRGLQWMDANFSATENPGRNTYFYYYMYGVERVGLASGYKFFGGHDWYREGAAELIRRLCKWDDQAKRFMIHGTTAGDGRAAKIKVDDLAFALMFLSRGRVPVAINKLQFDGNWDNRPRDVANLTTLLRESTETDLNWQIVNLSADPETWLDAPMLYIASHEALPWMKNQKNPDTQESGVIGFPELVKLKQYLDLGGMILAVNEGSVRHFADSVEKAGSLMYPHYSWRTLPEDHWAYTIHGPVKGRKPVLRGLSNGVRELMVLSPGSDLSETFQKNDLKQAGEIKTATNLYFYASEMNRPRARLERHWNSTASAATAQAQLQVTLVRASHEGNWNPEPRALDIFAGVLAEQRGISAKLVDAPLATIHQLSPPPQLVIISGIEERAFSVEQIQAIKTYVESGGVILFETPGGRGNFTTSAEQMATATLNRPIESVLRSRIITGEGLAGAKDITRVEYRPFALQSFGTRETAPRLRGMTIKDGARGGPQILFSREDISNALLGQPRWGVSGYSSASARELLMNIVQHAMAK